MQTIFPYLTARVTWAEWTTPLHVPYTVRMYVPGGVVRDVLIVSVEEPDLVTLTLLNDAMALFGKPATLSVTVPVKPLRAPTDTE